MPDNQFWKMTEINESNVAEDTGIYLVVVTPRLWRELSRSDSDRPLGEYSIVNKLYGTVEATSFSLPIALRTAQALQEAYNELTKKPAKGEVDGTVVSFVRKDRTE